MEQQQLPTLPNDVVRHIIKCARLDIDTRLGLRVKPGRLTEDPAYEGVRERLRVMHARRTDAWERNKRDGGGFALEYFKSSEVVIGDRRSMHVGIEVWGPSSLDSNVRMSIKAIETVLDDPLDPLAHLLPPGGGEAFVRRGTYCHVQTGEACRPIFDDDNDDVYDLY